MDEVEEGGRGRKGLSKEEETWVRGISRDLSKVEVEGMERTSVVDGGEVAE